MVDPNLGTSPRFLNYCLSWARFLALGGHLILITIIVDSFVAIPVGSGLLSESAGRIVLTSYVHWGYFFGTPVVFGLLMVNVCSRFYEPLPA